MVLIAHLSNTPPNAHRIVSLNLLWFLLFMPQLTNRQKKRVNLDERDLAIRNKSLMGALSAAVIALVGAAGIAEVAVGLDGLVSVNTITIVLQFSLVAAVLAWAVATLIQYGRGGGKNE